MEQKGKRLYFIDAMRAWAILMMLQGHFIDGLLDPVYRDPENSFFAIWKYFRGITAPVFFTVSGFIFTFLLVRVPVRGIENPRVKKGFKRGLQLILIGYLLRTNFLGLIKGQLYASFFLVDVLHCIGISLLIIVGLYLLTVRLKRWAFPLVLLLTTLALFVFEPYYKNWDYGGIPAALANYFTRQNGSVFTIIPWVGYTTIGAFLSFIFSRYKERKNFYPAAIISSLAGGFLLMKYASAFFSMLGRTTGLEVFHKIVENNYLFIRLGDVLVVFAVFMILRKLLEYRSLLRIGQSTLSIYVIHFIILYGSFTGMGLYRYLNHSLSPAAAIGGAVLFMIACTWIALLYERYEFRIKSYIRTALGRFFRKFSAAATLFLKYIRTSILRLGRLLGWVNS